jgi:hypothetical protein
MLSRKYGPFSGFRIPPRGIAFIHLPLVLGHLKVLIHAFDNLVVGGCQRPFRASPGGIPAL